jgi:serine/threonine-protein kinase HipA
MQLGVWLGPTRVGTLVRLPDDRNVFTFDPAYEADPNRPVLSLGFKAAAGGLDIPRPTHVKLPPFFSNLLPEGHLRDYLAARGRVKSVREFCLLALLGEDLPGAVVVRSELEGPWTPRVHPSSAAAERDSPLRFSLAGIQLKFSALMESEGGLTIPAQGAGGDWIVKLPSSNYQNVPEHEHVMLDLAAAVGLAVPEHRLVEIADIKGLPDDIGPFQGRAALAVMRFDRGPGGQRIHSEDFGQVFRLYPDNRYGKASSENIGRVLWAEAGMNSSLEFVRRLAFMVLTGNADMHVKNWSVRYLDGRAAELAPAYDLIGTVVYLPSDKELGLSLGGEKAMSAIDLGAFDRFAEGVGLPVAAVRAAVRDTVHQFRQVWKEHPAVGRLPKDQREALEAHMQSVPVSRET